MALLPFKTNDENGNPLFVSSKIIKGQNLEFIPYAERPNSPQESFVNGVFRVRRTYDVPWHMRWHFMYAMLGDSGLEQDGKINRRVPHGYHIRDFPSIYDNFNPGDDLLGGMETTLPSPWLFANAIESVEPIAFDGKDSMYLILTEEQLFGDLVNANLTPVNGGESPPPVSGESPVISKEVKRQRIRSNPKSLGEENLTRQGNSMVNPGIKRLRFVREQLTKHQVKIVYKDVIREIKKEEKRRIKNEKISPEERKKSYQQFVKDLKKENKKPLQSSHKKFNALKGEFGGNYPDMVSGEDPLYVGENAPPYAFPEGVFEQDGPLHGKLDATAVCKYKLARITVSYENVQHRIRQSQSSAWAGIEELVYDSFMTFYRLPTAEVLSLPLGAFRFYDKDPSKRYVVTGSNMRLESQEEIMITWHQVPFVPDAVRSHIGKVNDNWFPIGHLHIADNSTEIDLNKRVFAAPGTLLLTNVELKPSKGFFSRRIYDINYKFKYFHATEDGELAYSDDIFIKASHPCDPNGSQLVCQKMAKGHNFFLRYLFYNPKANQTEDATSGDIQKTFIYTVSGECALSGASNVYEKCSDPFAGVNYIRQYITHDGCPTGRPVYASANFDELFMTPVGAEGCNTDIAGNAPVVSGVNPGPIAFSAKEKTTRKGTSFNTTLNDHLKAKMIKPTIQKPSTRNPRLRK